MTVSSTTLVVVDFRVTDPDATDLRLPLVDEGIVGGMTRDGFVGVAMERRAGGRAGPSSSSRLRFVGVTGADMRLLTLRELRAMTLIPLTRSYMFWSAIGKK